MPENTLPVRLTSIWPAVAHRCGKETSQCVYTISRSQHLVFAPGWLSTDDGIPQKPGVSNTHNTVTPRSIACTMHEVIVRRTDYLSNIKL